MTKRLAALLAGVAVLAAGCGTGNGGSAVPTPATAAPAATTAPAPTATTPAPGPTGPDPSTWTSGPVVVVHNVPVPPVPLVVGIRSAAHSNEGYDRIVFDVSGPLPGYEVRYVDSPVLDPSGLPANVPGRRFLQITLRPAQAHNDAGTSTVTPRSATVGYPMLKAYAITGDFEGVLTVVLGLDDVVGYRVGELSGRIYLDVAA